MLQEEYINRRANLIKLLEDDSIAVVFAGEAPRKSADETFPLTPNRNFYYLTGIDEAKDILMLLKWHGQVFQFLFISRFDEVKAKWVGATYSKEEAQAFSGLTNILYLDEFEDHFATFSARIKKVYLDLERQGFKEAWTPAQCFAQAIKEKYPGLAVANCYDLLAQLRMVKSPAEIAEIRKAIAITKYGVETLMKHAKESIGQKEYYLEGYFDCAIKQKGASDFAFETIAAGGKNACILHYRANNGPLNNGDLVLFDLGAEQEYYKSDITRTFPLNGKFTPRQKQIYEIVLGGQQVILSNVKEGVTCQQLNQYLISYYVKELKKIGLIKKDEEVLKYYFHGCSHHIGLDTHDAQVLGMPLKEGCVISNEPGLYIAEEGIGIRIEDDVLVKKNGYEVLSQDIIRSVEDIEAFMKK